MKALAKQQVLIIVAVNLLMLLVAEGAVRILTYHGLLPYRRYMTEAPTVLDDINPYFGVWHHPNVTAKQEGPCYNVTINTNSYGARDRERTIKSGGKERMIVLGDSFVEGFGVEEEERLTEQAEKLSGVEMLNFGTSGSFSSTQEYLLHKTLASKFEHTHLAIFLLPDNDFYENRSENFDPNRYRPYLRKNKQGEYEIYYTVSFEERKLFIGMKSSRRFRRQIYNRVYLLNLLRQLGDVFESSTLKDAVSERFLGITDTSYDDYSKEDLEKLLWGYARLIELAGERPVTIFVIPREVDFVEAEAGRSGEQLIKDLNDFAAGYENVGVFDLLPYFRKRLDEEGLKRNDVFLPCDGHWSPTGHGFAAEALAFQFITRDGSNSS